MLLKKSAVGIALLVAAASASAQTTDPGLNAAIAARAKAVDSRDVAGVAKTTADDYIAVNPTGSITNKTQRLDGLKQPAAPGSKPPIPTRVEAAHIYGTGAVVRVRATDNRQLFVWTKNAQGWQAVAVHIIPDAPFPPAQTAANRPKTPEPSAVVAPAGLSGERAAVFAAFKKIQDAYFSGDRATYEKMTAPEHVRINVGGIIRFGREGDINIDGPRTQPKFSDITIEVRDQIAVMRWKETPASGNAQWLTRAFAKTPAGWMQVATVSSFAAKTGS